MTTQITIQVPGGVETDLDMNRVIYRTASFSMQVDGVAGEFYLQIRDPQHDETFVTGSIIRLYIDSIVRFGGFLLTATKTWPLMEDTTIPTAAVRFWELKGTDWNILWTKQVVHDPAHTTMPYKMYPIGTYDDTILNDVLDHYTDIAEFCPTRSITRVGIVILDILANKQDGGGAPWNQGSYLNEPFAAAKAATGGIYYINAAGVITYCDVETVNATLGLSDTPDSDTGTVGYRITKIAGMGDQLCNDALVWGAALGSSQIVFRRVQDTASIAAHGRWQKGLYSGGLYRSSSIDTVAGSMVYGTPSSLRGAKDNKVVMTCTVNDAPFSAGEKVSCKNHVWGFDMVLPVRKVTYLFPTPDNIVSELLLSYDVDVAWSIFEYAPIPTSRLPSLVVPPPPPILPPVNPGGCSDTVCGITESFPAAIGSGWGTSDAGYAWAQSGSSNGASKVAYGGGSYTSVLFGWLTTGTTSGAVNETMVLTNAVMQGGDFTAKVRLGVYDNSGIPSPDTVTQSVDCTFNTISFGWNYNSGTQIVYVDDGLGGRYTAVVSHTFWNDLSDYAILKVQVVGGVASVKLYDETFTEPAWMAFGSVGFGGHSTSQIGINLYGTGTDNRGMQVQLIDVSDLNRCTAVQFDDFNRTVAAGWGTATPSGSVWSTYNPTLHGTSSVDGSNGVMSVVASDANINQTVVATGPWSLSEWTMTCRINVDIADNTEIDFLLGSYPPGPYLSVYVGSRYSGNALELRTINADPTVSLSAFVSGAWYWVKWNYVRGGTLQAKVWQDGTTEPTWQITADDAGDTYTPPNFAVQALDDNNDGSTRVISIDSIDFDYAGKPCYPSGPVPGGDPNNVISVDPSPGSIKVTNNITYTSASPLVSYLPTAYLPGSVQMWFNGLLQTPGTDYTETDPVGDPGASPHGGNITLAALPHGATNPGGVAVVVTIIYVQNGPFAGTAVWPAGALVGGPCDTVFPDAPSSTTDQTSAIQSWLAANSGKNCCLAPGVSYRVDGRIWLDAWTGTFDGKGSMLRRYVTPSSEIPLIKLTAASYVTFQNLAVRADCTQTDVATRTLGTREGEHAIDIETVDHVSVLNCQLTNTWGDGCYVRGIDPPYTPSSYVTVDGCTFDANGRNNVSFISATDVLIKNSALSNSALHAIDGEPNRSTDTFQRIMVQDCTIESWGLSVGSFGPGYASVFTPGPGGVCTLSDITLNRLTIARPSSQQPFRVSGGSSGNRALRVTVTNTTPSGTGGNCQFDHIDTLVWSGNGSLTHSDTDVV